MEAVREAGIRLRDSSLQEISDAIGLAMTRRKLPTRSSPGQALTGAGRYEWVFEDDSKIVVDWPQRLDDRAGRPESAKVPHAELHGPHGERLDEQGIVVPERSNPAHMPITIGQRGKRVPRLSLVYGQSSVSGRRRTRPRGRSRCGRYGRERAEPTGE